jgi:hypothetical protein
VPVLLAAARVESALGRTEAARSDLGAATRLAKKIGWKGLIFEARLAAAEVDAADGSSSSATEAASLAGDAHSTGFERIAKRADLLAARRS